MYNLKKNMKNQILKYGKWIVHQMMKYIMQRQIFISQLLTKLEIFRLQKRELIWHDDNFIFQYLFLFLVNYLWKYDIYI